MFGISQLWGQIGKSCTLSWEQQAKYGEHVLLCTRCSKLERARSLGNSWTLTSGPHIANSSPATPAPGGSTHTHQETLGWTLSLLFLMQHSWGLCGSHAQPPSTQVGQEMLAKRKLHVQMSPGQCHPGSGWPLRLLAGVAWSAGQLVPSEQDRGAQRRDGKPCAVYRY